MRRLLAPAVCTIALGLSTAVAAAAPSRIAARSALPVVCGQIKHGPYASWTLTPPGQKPVQIKGTTWTVFSNGGIACGTAMKVGKTLLVRYPASVKTLTHVIKPTLKGFDLCSSSPKNGEVSCYDLKRSRNVTLFETGTYTLAQVKQFAATGQLGGR